jgi:hypothetical protein
MASDLNKTAVFALHRNRRRITQQGMSGRGRGGGRGGFAARRDIPLADKVDSLRDALYPKRVFYDLRGFPQNAPWTINQVAELAGTPLNSHDGADDATANLVSRLMVVPAANSLNPREPMRNWAPWLPQELLETGPVKPRRKRQLVKPVRRGGTVIVPVVEERKKPTVAAGSDASGTDKESDSADEVISGAGCDDDDDGGDDGGSGDELTM